MAKQDYLNVFDLEGSYAEGGGSFFKAGRYSVEEGGAYFTMFDFNGKADEPVPALCLELQARDEAGKKMGEPEPQHWPVRGKDIELCLPVKGQKGAFAGLKLTGQYDQLLKGGEFHVFLTYLRKAEFDMDQYDGDVTALGGNLDAMWDQTPDPFDVQKRKQKLESGEALGRGGKKDYGPRMIVVVSELVKKGKAASKPAKQAADDKPAKAASKPNGKPKALTAQELLAKYIEEEMHNASAREATSRPLIRMEISKWIKEEQGLDADMAKAVQELVNDDDELKSTLKTFGWLLKGREIHPPAEE